MGEILDTHVSLQRREVLQDDNSDDDMNSSSDAESDSEDDIVISHLCSSDSSESDSYSKGNQQWQSTCCSTGLWPNPIWAQYCEVVLSLSWLFFVLVDPCRWTVWKCSPVCSRLKEINSPPLLCLFILVTPSSFLIFFLWSSCFVPSPSPGINIEWSLIVQYTDEPSRGIRPLARTTVTDGNGYQKQQMTSVNVLRMSVMLAHRRALRTDRKWNYHSVRGYRGYHFLTLILYVWSSVIGLPADYEWHNNMCTV